MKSSDILKSIKELTSFNCITEGSSMLSYSKNMRPVAHYEVVDNKLYVVQYGKSYTEINSFSEFRVNEYNKKYGTDYELIFQFAK